MITRHPAIMGWLQNSCTWGSPAQGLHTLQGQHALCRPLLSAARGWLCAACVHSAHWSTRRYRLRCKSEHAYSTLAAPIEVVEAYLCQEAGWGPQALRGSPGCMLGTAGCPMARCPAPAAPRELASHRQPASAPARHLAACNPQRSQCHAHVDTGNCPAGIPPDGLTDSGSRRPGRLRDACMGSLTGARLRAGEQQRLCTGHILLLGAALQP